MTVGHHRQLPKAGKVIGRNYLQVSNVVAGVVPTIGPAGHGDGIQGIADRAVSDGVEVHLEALRIEPRNKLREQVRVNEVNSLI